jgi:hypothetical protein
MSRIEAGRPGWIRFAFTKRPQSLCLNRSFSFLQNHHLVLMLRAVRKRGPRSILAPPYGGRKVRRGLYGSADSIILGSHETQAPEDAATGACGICGVTVRRFCAGGLGTLVMRIGPVSRFDLTVPAVIGLLFSFRLFLRFFLLLLLLPARLGVAIRVVMAAGG